MSGRVRRAPTRFLNHAREEGDGPGLAWPASVYLCLGETEQVSRWNLSCGSHIGSVLGHKFPAGFSPETEGFGFSAEDSELVLIAPEDKLSLSKHAGPPQHT